MKKEGIKFENNLFKITWPIFAETLLLMLLGSMDIFMLGKYSDDAVGAVGIVNQIINMLNLLFVIITSGTTIICSQYIGAKKKDEDIMKLVGTSLVINTFFGGLISLLILLFSNFILKCMNVAPEFMLYSSQYIRIVGGFIIVQAITATFTSVLRSFGFTRICMYTTLVMNIFNIILNYILIFGKFGAPSLGVQGSATGTTISKILGTVFLGYYLFKKILPNFSVKYLKKIEKKEVKNILHMGVPSAGENISYSLAKLVATVILTHISIAAVTTNSYINNICIFIFVFSVSIGQGSAIIVGRLVGKGNPKEAYDLCFSSLKKAFITSTILGIIVAILARKIFGIFTNNEEIIALGASVLLVNAFLEPGRTFNLVIINCLRACGDVRFPVYVGICSMWAIGVGLAYILSITLNLGMPGMWIALSLDEWVRGIIMYFRWKSKKWHGKAIVSNEKSLAF
ncbi:MATE family efflux transporter [Clostridium sp.]|uniref:MATE family efflux transporter n=1 Tax=Clostridium sp. TaxID=1506 RepID=UPI00263944A1|nr:MATE family efflux transporter [Clostridium sp.]